jgi:hypothetical protein
VYFYYVAKSLHSNHLKKYEGEYFGAADHTAIGPLSSDAAMQEFLTLKPQGVPPSDIPVARSDKDKIDVKRLFDLYVQRAQMTNRVWRIIPWVLGYFLCAMAIGYLTHQTPDRLFIRGGISDWIDRILLLLAVVVCLFVLFYVLDTVHLAGWFLNYLSSPEASTTGFSGHCRTAWPPEFLKQHAVLKGVRMEHLDGWFDVKFAVEKTREVWKVMLFPFILLSLLVASRLELFDLWCWPWTLVAMLVANFLILAACWQLVRRMASKVRKDALKDLDDDISMVSDSKMKMFVVPTAEDPGRRLRKGVYLGRLKKLRDEIKQEKGGAFADLIQDPANLALVVPTGISGLLAVLAEYLIK